MSTQPQPAYLLPSTLTLAQENALRDICEQRKNISDEAEDAANEILEILDNPHHGDPAYNEPDEMPYERTGRGQGFW